MGVELRAKHCCVRELGSCLDAHKAKVQRNPKTELQDECLAAAVLASHRCSFLAGMPLNLSSGWNISWGIIAERVF
jgi:hypothetical protein